MELNYETCIVTVIFEVKELSLPALFCVFLLQYPNQESHVACLLSEQNPYKNKHFLIKTKAYPFCIVIKYSYVHNVYQKFIDKNSFTALF